MPELPEVETMRRGIQTITGRTILNVVFPRCRCKPISITPSRPNFKRRVCGQTIAAVDRIAKRIVIRLGNSDAIVFEPRMTGLVLLSDPPSESHLRVGLEFVETEAPLWFWDRRGLGTVNLWNELQIQTELGPNKLGPDALRISCAQLKQNLRQSQRFIKVALLDQKAIAGIGNLYASEILHVARIHPEKKCCHLRHKQWESLLTATKLVLRDAIHYEGSTLSDGTYRNALNKSGGYQNHHRVYARQDADCPRCGATIVRRVHAQRSTFFCPACQKK